MVATNHTRRSLARKRAAMLSRKCRRTIPVVLSVCFAPTVTFLNFLRANKNFHDRILKYPAQSVSRYPGVKFENFGTCFPPPGCRFDDHFLKHFEFWRQVVLLCVVFCVGPVCCPNLIVLVGKVPCTFATFKCVFPSRQSMWLFFPRFVYHLLSFFVECDVFIFLFNMPVRGDNPACYRNLIVLAGEVPCIFAMSKRVFPSHQSMWLFLPHFIFLFV